MLTINEIFSVRLSSFQLQVLKFTNIGETFNSFVLEIIQNQSKQNFRGKIGIQHRKLSLTTSFHVASGRNINFISISSLKSIRDMTV